MPSRPARSAAALALAASATTFAYVGSAAPAQAAGYNGYCKTSSGVTVVVDFRNLGGGVAIRCSPVGSGATGLQALQAAGIPVEGTRDGGLSVACRIYGKPTATQDLPGGYHESCARMPPANAYWSYWQAPNGGSWSYSQKGLSNSRVIPGGFEGWSFSEGSSAAPRAAATRPSAPAPQPTSTHTTQPPRHTTTTAPGHQSTTTAKQPAPSKRDGGAAGASQSKSTAASKAAAEQKSTSAKARTSSASSSSSSASKSSHSKSSSSSSGSSSALGTRSGQPTNAAGAPIKNSDDLIKDAKQDNSSSINATTVVGGGVLGALAIGGVVVGIIRKRKLG